MNDNDIELEKALILLCYVPGAGFYKRCSIRNVDEIDRKKLFSLCLIDSTLESCRRTILGDRLILEFVRYWDDSYPKPYFKEQPFGTLLEFLERDKDFNERYKRLLQERNGEFPAAVPADTTFQIFAKSDEAAPFGAAIVSIDLQPVILGKVENVENGIGEVKEGIEKIVERLDKSKEIQTPQDYTKIKDHLERRRLMHNDGIKPSDISRWEKEHRDEIDSSNYPLPSTDVNAIKKSLQRQRKSRDKSRDNGDKVGTK